MYHVGDYVYVEPAEPNLQPHIIYIERLWQDDTGQSHHWYILLERHIVTYSNMS